MIFIISAPSGAGKSTLIQYLLSQRNDLDFAISATTRLPRPSEKNGVDYYFISQKEFENKILHNDFIEYEQVYKGIFYGTLKSEIERINAIGHHIIFEVDVNGGIKLKQVFGNKALAIFIAPPSIDELRFRLMNRKTESERDIDERMNKAHEEMKQAHKYDIIITNNDIHIAQHQLLDIVSNSI